MLGLDILRMYFIGVLAGNDLNPLETLAQVEEEQNYETSEKILRDVRNQSYFPRFLVAEIRSKISQIELDVRQIKQIIYILQGKIESLESKQDATLSELCRLSQILSDEGNTSTKSKLITEKRPSRIHKANVTDIMHAAVVTHCNHSRLYHFRNTLTNLLEKARYNGQHDDDDYNDASYDILNNATHLVPCKQK
ncbi:hypothetical protein YC2023_087686 [Brassica napus]